MNKKQLIRYAIAAVGIVIFVYFGFRAISIYTNPPTLNDFVKTSVAQEARKLFEQAQNVWNNQFAKKAFFSLVGLFLILVSTLPKKKLWIPKVLFSTGLVALIIHHLLADGKISSILADGIQISVLWILAAFVVKGSGMACTVWRWKVLLDGQGFKIPLKHLVQSFLIGRFIGSFAPGTSGLDGYRAYDISRYTGKVARSLAVIFVEKLIGFFVLGTLLLVAVPLGKSLFSQNHVNATALVMMALAFLGMMGASFVVLFKPGIIRWVTDKFIPKTSPVRKKVDKAVRAVAAYEKRKLHLVKAMAIGFGVHLCTIGMYFCTSRAIFSAPNNVDLFVTSALMIGATVLPLSIAGIGMREGVYVFFLGPIAAIYAFMGYLVGEIISLVGGPVWLVRRSDYYEVMKAQRDAINQDVEDDDEDDSAEQAAEDVAAPNGPKASFLDYGLTGLGAGLLAGLAVAILDALRLWLIGGIDVSLPGYASILYGPFVGILGACFGVALAIWDRLIAKPAARRIVLGTFVGVILFSVFALAIGYFYLFRDVFGEKLGLFAPKMMGSILGLVVAVTLLSVGVAFGLRKLFSGKLEKFANHLVSVGLYAVVTIVLVVMWLAGGHASAGEALQPVKNKKAPNVVLVMNDTHRADYAGPYGNKEGLTPNLDRFAGDSVVYNGFANASWTRPSVSTILTGRYASSHTAMMKGSMLPEEITTLAEVMLSGGYETIGFATNYNLTPFFKVDQGFHDYKYLPPSLPLGSTDEQSKLIFIEVAKKITAKLAGKQEHPDDYYVVGEVVTDKALERLDKRDKARPFFMFLSYMDVHDPYFRHPFDGYGISHRANPNPDPNDTELVEEMKSLYKGEIKYWDAQFGRLIEGLKQRGVYDDTLILVVSDHGEEFGEHGGFWHGTTLYDEMLHILFIVKYAKNSENAAFAGQKTDMWHQLVDVAPLIIQESGLTIPKEMQGLPSRVNEHDTVFAEEDHQGNILTSARYENKDGNLQKIISANEDNPRGVKPIEVYDVAADAKEQNDLSGNAELVKQGMGRLKKAHENALKGRATASTGELSGDMKSQLDALGYMEDEK
ncbi:MAG: sulfatase-like hydrolase/transferase [Deltaproteobacteria bacterium]|nr:sulfatase-like hydrolase/transferase [Deltaproteobacteria bacterium]MBN2671247.1 sulfatase-like hydrolase/transferase [Deltaproteobacteria bacterium]